MHSINLGQMASEGTSGTELHPNMFDVAHGLGGRLQGGIARDLTRILVLINKRAKQMVCFHADSSVERKTK